MQWMTYQTGDNDEYDDVMPCIRPSISTALYTGDFNDYQIMKSLVKRSEIKRKSQVLANELFMAKLRLSTKD